MNEIALHIDFLLHSHDCVIVPGLGGFVVNSTDVKKSGLWGLDAPSFELLFNNKLTYNDGLLAESLMKTDNVSYDVAIKKIKAACDELKSRLAKDEEVEWENLGVFRTDKDGNAIFMPNKDYVRPQFFGLSSASLKPAVLALSTRDNDERAYPIRSIVRYVSTAIAAAMVLFFVVLSLNNTTPNGQFAEIVSKPLIFSSSSPKMNTPKQASSTAVVPKDKLPATAEASSTISQSSTSKRKYYIIVGVYEVREIAEKNLAKLKEQGFATASMIERPMRLDVYSASFSDRDEAQTYLHKFQADNPQYKDAWILRR